MKTTNQVTCPECNSTNVELKGRTIKLKPRYLCKDCNTVFVYILVSMKRAKDLNIKGRRK